MLTTVRTILPCSRALGGLTRNAFRSHTVAASHAIKTTANWRPTATTINSLSPISSWISPASRSLSTKTNSDPGDFSGQKRIYYGSLAPRMKAVKLFSLTTSLAGLAAQPILMEQGMKMGGTGMAVFICGFAGFFTFVTPLLLHFITKKYVTEIHFNPATEEYTATTISIILHKIHTKFRPSDVKVPDVPGMFTSFLIGDKPLFVDPSLFEDPEHYVKIMGYDKPIDFKLLNKDEAESPSKADKSETQK